jgi:hypothetical protein
MVLTMGESRVIMGETKLLAMSDNEYRAELPGTWVESADIYNLTVSCGASYVPFHFTVSSSNRNLYVALGVSSVRRSAAFHIEAGEHRPYRAFRGSMGFRYIDTSTDGCTGVLEEEEQHREKQSSIGSPAKAGISVSRSFRSPATAVGPHPPYGLRDVSTAACKALQGNT